MNEMWTYGLVTLVWAGVAFITVGIAIELTALIDWWRIKGP